jgi:glutathione peroxidase
VCLGHVTKAGDGLATDRLVLDKSDPTYHSSPVALSARTSRLILFATLLAGCARPRAAQLLGSATVEQSSKASEKETVMSLYSLTATSIDLKPQPLSAWKGKVTLVVNTASECGNTPQYAGLEQLWRQYHDRDFAILGFPSNDFGGQEPGGEAEIRKFCDLRYHVTFPLFAKVKTKGEGQSPVYQFLSAKHDQPKWNFHKYLVARDGHVIRAFGAKVQPDDPQLRAAIDDALQQK